MFAITGITGNVGGEVARALLEAGEPVRAVVRNAARGDLWAKRGCAVVTADIHDSRALGEAFKGAEGVFVMVPPVFDPGECFPEAASVAASLRSALETARPDKVVYLSTIGAQATQTNLLTQHTMIEKALRDSPVPVTFLRPGWFMENTAWDVEPARTTGVVPSFLQPLDRAVPMVATADIGRVAAELLRETWAGSRLVELEGPRRVTPNDVAAAFTRILGHPVKMEIVPRETWEALFLSQGMKNPEPRIRMLDGFNEGWIDFEGDDARVRKGVVGLESVLKTLLER